MKQELLLALEMRGFLHQCLKNLSSTNLSSTFFPDRVTHSILLSRAVNSIEKHLGMDLRSGLLMEFGSSARIQSRNRNGGSEVSGREVVGLEVWSCNGKCIISQNPKRAWKLGQYQKSLRDSCKTNKVEVIGL